MAQKLTDVRARKVALVDQGANQYADILLFKAAGDMMQCPECGYMNPKGANTCKSCGADMMAKAQTKTEDGTEYPAAAFAYVPDPEKPSTWKLRLWESPSEKVTVRQVGRAIAALGPGGFRGNRVEIPAGDLAGVKAKIRAAWRRVNPDKSPEDMPDVVKGEDSMTPEELEKRLGELEGQVTTLTKARDDEKARADKAEAALKAAQQHGEDKRSELEKRIDGLPAEMRADVAKAVEAERNQRIELEKRIAAAEERESLAKFTEDAGKQYPNIPGANLGPVLKAISGLPKEIVDRVGEVLTAANKAFGSIMSPIGSSMTEWETSATAKIQKRADEIRKADPKITQADAFVRAANEDPERLRQYRIETGHRA